MRKIYGAVCLGILVTQALGQGNAEGWKKEAEADIRKLREARLLQVVDRLLTLAGPFPLPIRLQDAQGNKIGEVVVVTGNREDLLKMTSPTAPIVPLIGTLPSGGENPNRPVSESNLPRNPLLKDSYKAVMELVGPEQDRLKAMQKERMFQLFFFAGDESQDNLKKLGGYRSIRLGWFEEVLGSGSQSPLLIASPNLDVLNELRWFGSDCLLGMGILDGQVPGSADTFVSGLMRVLGFARSGDK